MLVSLFTSSMPTVWTIDWSSIGMATSCKNVSIIKNKFDFDWKSQPESKNQFKLNSSLAEAHSIWKTDF